MTFSHTKSAALKTRHYFSTHRELGWVAYQERQGPESCLELLSLEAVEHDGHTHVHVHLAHPLLPQETSGLSHPARAASVTQKTLKGVEHVSESWRHL